MSYRVRDYVTSSDLGEASWEMVQACKGGNPTWALKLEGYWRPIGDDDARSLRTLGAKLREVFVGVAL